MSHEKTSAEDSAEQYRNERSNGIDWETGSWIRGFEWLLLLLLSAVLVLSLDWTGLGGMRRGGEKLPNGE